MRKFGKTQRKLRSILNICHPLFSETLLLVQAMCLNMGDLSMTQIDPELTYTLGEFMDDQEHYIRDVSLKVQRYYSMLHHLTIRTCWDDVINAGLAVERDERKYSAPKRVNELRKMQRMKHSPPTGNNKPEDLDIGVWVDASQDVKEDLDARRISQCTRLARLIYQIDCLFCNTLHQIYINSLSKTAKYLSQQMATFPSSDEIKNIVKGYIADLDIPNILEDGSDDDNDDDDDKAGVSGLGGNDQKETLEKSKGDTPKTDQQAPPSGAVAQMEKSNAPNVLIVRNVVDSSSTAPMSTASVQTNFRSDSVGMDTSSVYDNAEYIPFMRGDMDLSDSLDTTSSTISDDDDANSMGNHFEYVEYPVRDIEQVDFLDLDAPAITGTEMRVYRMPNEQTYDELMNDQVVTGVEETNNEDVTIIDHFGTIEPVELINDDDEPLSEDLTITSDDKFNPGISQNVPTFFVTTDAAQQRYLNSKVFPPFDKLKDLKLKQKINEKKSKPIKNELVLLKNTIPVQQNMLKEKAKQGKTIMVTPNKEVLKVKMDVSEDEACEHISQAETGKLLKDSQLSGVFSHLFDQVLESSVDKTADHTEVVLDFPILDGTTWETQNIGQYMNIRSSTSTSVDASVSTPSGTWPNNVPENKADNKQLGNDDSSLSSGSSKNKPFASKGFHDINSQKPNRKEGSDSNNNVIGEDSVDGHMDSNIDRVTYPLSPCQPTVSFYTVEKKQTKESEKGESSQINILEFLAREMEYPHSHVDYNTYHNSTRSLYPGRSIPDTFVEEVSDDVSKSDILVDRKNGTRITSDESKNLHIIARTGVRKDGGKRRKGGKTSGGLSASGEVVAGGNVQLQSTQGSLGSPVVKTGSLSKLVSFSNVDSSLTDEAPSSLGKEGCSVSRMDGQNALRDTTGSMLIRAASFDDLREDSADIKNIREMFSYQISSPRPELNDAGHDVEQSSIHNSPNPRFNSPVLTYRVSSSVQLDDITENQLVNIIDQPLQDEADNSLTLSGGAPADVEKNVSTNRKENADSLVLDQQSTVSSSGQESTDSNEKQQNRNCLLAGGGGGSGPTSKVQLGVATGREIKPMFHAAIHIKDDVVTMMPDVYDFTGAAFNMIHDMEEHLLSFETLTSNAWFQTFVQPASLKETNKKIKGPSLETILRRDPNFVKEKNEIYGAIDGMFFFAGIYLGEMQQLYSKYFQHRYLLTADREPIYYLQMLQWHDTQLKIIERLPESQRLGTFLFDLTPYKDSVRLITTDNLSLIQLQLNGDAVQKTQRLMEKFEQILSVLESKPTLLDDLFIRLTTTDKLSDIIQDVENKDVNHIAELYNIIDRFAVPHTEADRRVFESCHYMISDIRRAGEVSLASRTEMIQGLEQCLDRDILWIQLQVKSRLKPLVENPMFLDGRVDAHHVRLALTQAETLVRSYVAKANFVREVQRYLEKPESQFKELFEISSRYVNTRNLWLLMADWDTKLDRWKHQSFTTLDIQKINSYTFKYMEACNKLEKVLPKNTVVTVFGEKMDVMLRWLNFIIEFRGQAVKPRHWRQIEEVLGVEFGDVLPLTLASLMSINAVDKQKVLHVILNKARAESNVQNEYDEVCRQCTDLVLPIHVKQKSLLENETAVTVYLMGDTFEIEESLNYCVMELERIDLSPHSSFLHESLELILHRIFESLENIVQWSEVQMKLTRLRRLLIRHPEIVQTMSTEASHYKHIFMEYSNFLERVQANPNVIHWCTSQELRDLVENKLTEIVSLYRVFKREIELRGSATDNAGRDPFQFGV
ncbi:uncharacterized protein LOC131956127 [Physella acuta]|uniref:uncharacterized protein LOC131956127 n=1 Tax=Physella acuta TaxID=109671 RepID=UPI0027DB9115|nr:uncharacterized protein LOC131956127 [Physella acuta]